MVSTEGRITIMLFGKQVETWIVAPAEPALYYSAERGWEPAEKTGETK